MEPDELYGLPLERFVPERDALARALRAERRRDDAAAVAKLRKPSLAAWAVNQLVRTQRPAVAELFAAGDAVRSAHEELLAGRGDARALRAAGERERAAVDALVATARGLIDADGHGLSAAVVERELRHAGLGLGSAADRQHGQAAQDDTAERAAAAERAARERAEHEAAERARAERKAAARAAELAARRRAERAARALRAAEQRRERAAAALDAADAALDEARAEAAAADAEHRAATKRARG